MPALFTASPARQKGNNAGLNEERTNAPIPALTCQLSPYPLPAARTQLRPSARGMAEDEPDRLRRVPSSGSASRHCARQQRTHARMAPLW